MSYQATAQRLEAGAARDADELAARLAAGLDTVIRPIEGGIRTVAHQLEEVNPPPEQYPLRIRGILNAWPDVYGSTIATEVSDAIRRASLCALLFSARRLDRVLRSGARLLRIFQPALVSPRGRRRPRRVVDTLFRRGRRRHLDDHVLGAFLSRGRERRTPAGGRGDRGPCAQLGPRGGLTHAARTLYRGWLASPPGPQDFVAPIGVSDVTGRECHSHGRRSHAVEGPHLRTGAEAVGRRGFVPRGAQPRNTAVAAHAGHAALTAAVGGECCSASPAVVRRRRAVVAGRRHLVRSHGCVQAYPPACRSGRQRQEKATWNSRCRSRPGTTRSAC